MDAGEENVGGTLCPTKRCILICARGEPEEIKTMADARQIREQVLRILSEVTNSRDVLTRPSLPLYESGLLDSLGTVNLILALGEELEVSIAPSEFDPTAWATPDAVVADVLQRLGVPAAEPV